MVLNLTHYPKTKELVKEYEMEDSIKEIRWINTSREESAVNLAKLYTTALLAQAPNILARNKARMFTDQLYCSVGNQIHLFAKEEGWDELGLENEDIVRLFKHLELGGSRYS